MTKTRDELEDELRSLVPSTPSNRVVDGIAERLTTTPTSSVEQDSWKWGAIALAVAACLSVVILWYPQSTKLTDGPSLPSVDTQFSELPPPTMLAYRQVFFQSPDALDELLDRHATDLLSPSSDDTAGLFQNLMAN